MTIKLYELADIVRLLMPISVPGSADRFSFKLTAPPRLSVPARPRGFWPLQSPGLGRIAGFL